MRKTLLIAAAALAASVISSEAQVYSQNIVGYANIPTPNSGVNYLLTVPFKIGASNGVNEVFPFPGTPEFSQVLLWDVNSASYTAIQIDSGSPTGWSYSSDSSTVSPLPTLAVGQGFFFSPGSPNYTNTFAGTIGVSVGASNVMTLASAGVNYLVGCPVPYAGAVTNGNPVTGAGGPNISIPAGVPEFTQLLIWDPISASYTAVQIDTGSPTGWSLSSDSSTVPVPTIGVGQGFFMSPGGANTQWKVGL